MMKFKKFISTLITLVTITIVISAVIKRIFIHGSDLKNIVLRKHDVMKDIGVKVSQENENPEPDPQVCRARRALNSVYGGCSPHANYIN